MNNLLKRIWHDPVVSKIIAGLILAALMGLFGLIKFIGLKNITNRIISLFKIDISVNLGLIIIFSIAILILLVWSFKKSKKKYNKMIENNINSLIGPFEITGWKEKDYKVGICFTKDLSFDFRIERSDLNQDFHIYYYVLFDSGKRYWVGFKPDTHGTPNHVDNAENTMIYNFTGYSIVHSEKISQTIKNRGIMKNDTPKSILLVRIRASEKIDKPIRYYFGFMGY